MPPTEKIQHTEQPKRSFEDVFAALNTDLEYNFQYLSGTDPEQRKFRIQLLNRHEDGNESALNEDQHAGYITLLQKDLADLDKGYMITLERIPSVHITIEEFAKESDSDTI